MSDGRISIWTKVGDEEYAAIKSQLEESSEGSASTKPTLTERFQRTKRFWVVTKLIAIFGWIYAVTKVFVFDVDALAAEYVGWWGEWLVRWRLLVLIVLLIVVMASVKRPLQPILYVAGFPILVVFWYLPKKLVAIRSWVAFLALTNASSIVFRRFRINAILVLAVFLSLLIVTFFDFAPALYFATAACATVLVYLYVRYLVASFKGSEFLRIQLHSLKKLYRSGFVKRFTSVQEDLKDATVVVFDHTKREMFLQQVSFGLVAYKALYFWAFQIDQYRKSNFPSIFSAISYAWLVLATVVLFTIMNSGLDRADPSAFSGPTARFFSMTRYSVASLYAGEIRGVSPESSVAELISIAATVGAGLLILTVAISFVQARRTDAQNRLFESTISSIREEAKAFRTRFEDEFETTPSEAIVRLEALKFSLAKFITGLSNQIPPDFSDDDDY